MQLTNLCGVECEGNIRTISASLLTNNNEQFPMAVQNMNEVVDSGTFRKPREQFELKTPGFSESTSAVEMSDDILHPCSQYPPAMPSYLI